MKIIITSVVSLFIQGITLLLSLSIASNYLDGEILRDWNLGIASYAFVSFFDFGASTFIMRDLSSAKSELVSRAKNLSKTMILSGVFISIFFLISNLVLFNITNFLFVIGAMFGRVIINIIGVTNAAFGEVTVEKLSKIIFSIIFLLIQFVFLKFNFGIYSLPISIYISVIIQFLYLFYVNEILYDILKNSQFAMITIWENRKEHFNWILYTLPAFFIFSFQVFAIGFWSDAKNVPIFNAVHQLLYTTIAISAIVSYISGPAISRLNYISIKTRNTLILNTAKVVSLTVALALSIVLILLPTIQKFMFKNLDLTVDLSLWCFYAFFIIIEVFQMSLVNALIYTGYTNFWKVNTASAIINILLCWLLIPKYGLWGAVISVIIAQTLTCNFFNIKLALKTLNLQWKTTLTILGISLISNVAILTINHLLKHNIVLSIAFLCIILLIYIKFIILPIKFILNQYNLLSRAC